MTKAAFRIREVDGPNAAEAIEQMHNVCMPEVELPPMDGYWWLAYRGREPVAYASLHPSLRYRNVGYLSIVGVLPSARGNALQRRLIKVREAKAKKLGWDILITDTIPENPASSNNLIKCGYVTYVPERPWKVDGALYWRKYLSGGEG